MAIFNSERLTGLLSSESELRTENHGICHVFTPPESKNEPSHRCHSPFPMPCWWRHGCVLIKIAIVLGWNSSSYCWSSIYSISLHVYVSNIIMILHVYVFKPLFFHVQITQKTMRIAPRLLPHLAVPWWMISQESMGDEISKNYANCGLSIYLHILQNIELYMGILWNIIDSYCWFNRCILWNI